MEGFLSLELLATYWMVEGFLQFGAFSYWSELCLFRVEGFHQLELLAKLDTIMSICIL